MSLNHQHHTVLVGRIYRHQSVAHCPTQQQRCSHGRHHALSQQPRQHHHYTHQLIGHYQWRLGTNHHGRTRVIWFEQSTVTTLGICSSTPHLKNTHIGHRFGWADRMGISGQSEFNHLGAMDQCRGHFGVFTGQPVVNSHHETRKHATDLRLKPPCVGTLDGSDPDQHHAHFTIGSLAVTQGFIRRFSDVAQLQHSTSETC